VSTPEAGPVAAAEPAPVERLPPGPPKAAAATPAAAAPTLVPAGDPDAAAPAAPVVAAPPPAAPPPAEAVAAAPVPAAVAVPAAAPAAPRYKDGTYTGWGTSRHGDIQATVVIADGRIASAAISECWTRYPCSWIVKLPPQVAERQSPEVDYVSGATQSANAFYYAVIDALAKAK
jgi:uncharacterized protein with FMN-binding domain